MNMITVNGNQYPARDFDVNLICDLEEKGVNLMSGISKLKLFPVIRAYVSCCMGVDVQVAGNEIQAHMLSGASIDNIADAMMKAMDESDFFRALQTTEESSDTTSKNSKAKAQ